MRHSLNLRLIWVITLIVLTMWIHHNNVLRVEATESKNTVSYNSALDLDEDSSNVVDVEPIIIEKVITVEKKVEVEKVVKPFKLKDLGVFKVTAYCPCEICCGEWTDSAKTKITSIGAGAYEGVTVAVDPSKIPYGTKLFSSEFGVRIATDCGGAIKGNRLDLYFSSHEKALEFGVKYVNLYCIED